MLRHSPRQRSPRRGCKSPGMRPDELRVLPFTPRQPGHGDSMSRCFSALRSFPADSSSPVPLQPPAGWPWGPAGPQHDLQTLSLELGPLQCQSYYPPRLPELLETSPLCAWFLGIGGFRGDIGRGRSSLAQRTKAQPGTGLGAGTGAGTELLPRLLLGCERCKTSGLW